MICNRIFLEIPEHLFVLVQLPGLRRVHTAIDKFKISGPQSAGGMQPFHLSLLQPLIIFPEYRRDQEGAVLSNFTFQLTAQEMQLKPFVELV